MMARWRNEQSTINEIRSTLARVPKKNPRSAQLRRLENTPKRKNPGNRCGP
jgi:hypothetical protein